MRIENNVLYDVEQSDIINGTFTIPEGVVAIGDRAFFQCQSLTNINFPTTLKTIGKFAFTSCSNLEEINLPSNLETIDDSAFCACTALKNVVLPENLKNLGSSAFSSCIRLESINIPEKITELSVQLFSRCEELKEIKLHDKIKTIGNRAFYKCSKLKNITLPKSIEKIENYAFANNTSLESIVLPESLKSIGFSVFSDCTNLSSINIPSNITTLSDRLFYNCSSLTKFQIPSSVTTIGSSVFKGCGLSKIEIPNSVTSIGNSVFANCKELEKVYLSKNISVIPEFAFDGCIKLNSLGLKQKTYYGIDGEIISQEEPNSIVIPNNINSIEKSAFSRCISISKVVCPNQLLELGEEAFKNCRSLFEIYLPINLTLLKDETFANCFNLQYLTLPKNLTHIGNHTFEDCQSLKSISLPESLKSIGDFAFSKCVELKNVDLPETLTEIPSHCFETCLSLDNINFPSSLKLIGENAFARTSISEVNMTDKVEECGKFAFLGCDHLKSAKLSQNLRTINEGTFQGCRHLTDVILPKNLQNLEKCAFFNCRDLKSINLPNGLKLIGSGAFYDCYNLENVKIPETVETIQLLAFDNCPKIDSLHIPNSVQNFENTLNTFKFFEKCENGFNLSNTETPNSIPANTIYINFPFLSRNWAFKDMLLKEQRQPNIALFYNSYLSKQSDERINEFLNHHNFTFFKQLPKPIFSDDKFKLYNVLYNLGVFSTPIEVNGKKIDYSQKVVGFLIEKIIKLELSMDELLQIFENMNTDGFKPEFTEFFLSKFDELIDEEGVHKGFISRCYNEFEEVQKTNTSNRGSQRQLKPTVMKFAYYFMENKFSGVNESNKHIADALSPYFHEQRIFDQALQIEQERIAKKSPEHILKKHLKEPSPFEQIDELFELISKSQGETLQNLLQTSVNQFSYEWLSKNDPQNLILGKLCSCCSHIEGGGYGIMRASIVDPYVQNLVIRNDMGKIVAKSTLYINPIESYGVFNNVEVNENIPDIQKQEIYEKFILGAKAFAEEYNKEHPDQPLKQITVGMNLNDLTYELQTQSRESKKIYKAIDYSKYGIPNQMYSGDSELEQYIVWENSNSPQIEK